MQSTLPKQARERKWYLMLFHVVWCEWKAKNQDFRDENVNSKLDGNPHTTKAKDERRWCTMLFHVVWWIGKHGIYWWWKSEIPNFMMRRDGSLYCSIMILPVNMKYSLKEGSDGRTCWGSWSMMIVVVAKLTYNFFLLVKSTLFFFQWDQKSSLPPTV